VNKFKLYLIITILTPIIWSCLFFGLKIKDVDVFKVWAVLTIFGQFSYVSYLAFSRKKSPTVLELSELISLGFVAAFYTSINSFLPKLPSL